MEYPILRLQSDLVKNNIRKMANKAKAEGLEFRPHFKTHQSEEIAEWFRDYGVTGITVSSLKMAEFFAQAGWKDITVAFPISVLDISRIKALASTCSLKLLINNLEVAKKVESLSSTSIYFYVEIDPNYGRSGVPISDIEKIEALVEFIKPSKKLHFEGFYAHAGHSYLCRKAEQIKDLAEPLLLKLTALKQTFGGLLCWGDTPSCSVLTEFKGVDQISPGNFVFYDWMQTKIGSCSESDIAVTLECPVVAKFKDRQEILIHGGAVHFSKEFIELEHGIKCFGQVRDTKTRSDESNYLKSISQEHGLISCTPSFFQSVEVGDIIEIYPIHSCLSANLMQAYVTDEGEIFEQFGSGAPFKG